ncbi:MAG TPA: dihydroorotate dehydrogenase electron transfer subunit [Syntrophorhabdaceae bacterium]|nr:dihydroorotate dehydrogenase electron transfer subunit [Syntrophorhabdaceae bacterium]
MDDIPGRIIENINVAPGYFRLVIRLERPLGKASPGQFVMLKIPGEEVFLRRPFSIFGSRGKTLVVMYRVAGKGTGCLSQALKKSPVMVLGPLGRGFTIKKRDAYLVVAGGIGFAGTRMLLEKLGEKATLFFGVGAKEELSVAEDLSGICVHVSTLDGSRGFRGDVVSLLGQHLDACRQKDMEVFACGPAGMVKSLRALLESGHIPCQVSVEERMACGMGLCFGCVVATNDEINPFKRVCKEGPVFSIWDLSL